MISLEPELLLILSLILVLNLVISYFGTEFTIYLASKFSVVDNPSSNPERKSQKLPIPLLGATTFILCSTFFTGLVWLMRKSIFAPVNINTLGEILGRNLSPFKLIWVFVAIAIILIAGFLDDKFKFKSKIMFLPIAAAIAVAVYFGDLRIEALSFPFNQIIPDNEYLHHLFSFLWIGFCLAATKFLDGHDGLVSTVGIIGFITIASTSLLIPVNQPLIFAMSLIWATGLLGFLPWNLPEAKIYLGEAGSQIIGFMIGVLSILSGAKVATASSIMSWFILDVIFVMSYRVLQKKNPFKGDRLHWHFRLMDMGFSKIQVLAITATILAITGFFGVTLPPSQKLYFLIGQTLFFVVVFVSTILLRKKV
jgi:UDP-GlcNAc:undecaprenyl-phosphate GlcNAc-1-phosphate transferase